MASITTKPASPYYYVSFRDAEGRQTSISLGIAHEGNDLAETIANRQQALTKAERVEENIRRGLPPETPPLAAQPGGIPSFAIFATLQNRKATGEPKYIYRLGTYVGTVCSYLGEESSNVPLNTLTCATFAALPDYLEAKGCSAATIKMQVQFVRGVFRAALNEGLIQINPLDAIRPSTPVASTVLAVTYDQTQNILDSTLVLDYRTAVLLGYYGGMDVVEASHRRWTELSQDLQTITYENHSYAGRLTTLTLPLHPVLAAHLAKVRGAGSSPFITPSLAALNDATLTTRFAKLFQDAGLPSGQGTSTGKGMVKDLRFASLRLAFALGLGHTGLLRLGRFIRSLPPAELSKRIEALPALRLNPLACLGQGPGAQPAAKKAPNKKG